MRSVFKAAALAVIALAFACVTRESPFRPDLTSFQVTVKGVYMPRGPLPDKKYVEFGQAGTPLPVVSKCQKQYGGEAGVPADKRGTTECPYAIPRGPVDLDLEIVALGKDGKALTTFSGPVSFRVVPGDMVEDYGYRTAQVVDGVGQAVVKVSHLYSDVRVWVEDAPAQPIFDGGVQDTTDLVAEPASRTFASAASEPVWFEDPTIAKIQIPDGFDNKSSPFVGQFITLGRPQAENTSPVLESCDNDPAHDGQPALLIVTGTDPSGFFVTDLNACRLPEQVPNAFTVPEPDGYFPGTFGSLFIYNYSFPDGLDQGDALWSVAGAVQEFTSTTQLTFPSWVIAEKVRFLPESQWGKYLSQIPIHDITLRTCGLSNASLPYVTDVLCGHNKSNLKMESMESGLVRIKNARFPRTFTNCDRDGDGQVPFFCEQPLDTGWAWTTCEFDGVSTMTEKQREEARCNIDCVTGQGAFARTVCSERSTFTGFGQFIAELSGPGPAEAGLDDTLALRTETLAITGGASVRTQLAWSTDNEVRIWCNTPVKFKFGDGTVEATDADEPLAANTLLDRYFDAGQTNVAFIADSAPGADAKCTVSLNPHTKINVVTKDAIPELQPDCDPNDADAAKAEQCKFFRGATYDVTGHLRHLQPGRPRWVITPRDRDDVCCHPGPGMQCPKPIQPCP